MVGLRSRGRVVGLRGWLLSSTALVAASLVAPSRAQAQSVVINDARVTQQILDSLLPTPASPLTALVTSTGSVIVPGLNSIAISGIAPGWTLTNNGNVQATGIGVYFQDNATVNNTGTIAQTGGGSGLVNVGLRIDGNGSITNSGTISGVTGILVYGGGTVANQASGTVNGGIIVGGTATVFQSGKAGVVVNDGLVTGNIVLNQGGTITNTGNVFGLLFPGSLIVNNAVGTVTNSGNVGAVFLGAGGTVSNSGTISNIDTPDGVRIQGGNGIVINSGLIEDNQTAVTITNSGTVTNTGTIQQTGGGSGLINNGIHIGETGSVTNSGTISGVTGILIDGGGTVNNQLGGTVNGGIIVGGTATVFQSGKTGVVLNDGSVIGSIQLNQGGTITNNGSVFGLLGPGFLSVSNASGTVTNNGTAGAVFLGAGGSVTNSGTISNADFGNGVRIEGGNGTVSNSGLIDDDQTAITITNSGTVSNTGTIQQTGGGSGLINNAIHIGETGSVTNSGTISGVTGILIDGAGTVNNQLGGTVNGGIIVGGTATVFQSGKTGVVLNDGSVIGSIQLNQGGTITNNGSVFGLLGPGFLSVSNAAGTVTNNGTAGAVFLGAGGSVTNSGTISNADIGNGVRIQGGNGTVSNSGLIEDDQTAVTITNAGTVDNSGRITGATGIQIGGGGTVTNSSTITGSGGLAIDFTGPAPQNDRLVLQSGSMLVGNVQGADGVDLLVLQGTNSEDIAKFLNFENLRMEGVDWTLTGAGTFSTGADIVAGTLRVNGDLTTPIVTVQNTGVLAGSGTVHGNVLASTGTVRPGPAGTTLSIAGGLTMASASRFQVDIANTSNSRVNAVGTALLQGGQIGVTFTPPSGTVLNNAQYTVLHADGGVSGTFGNSAINIGSYHFAVSYDPDDVFLSLTRTAFNDPSICASANQCAVGGALERLGPVIPGDLGTIVGNLALLDIAAQRAALSSMSGAQHPTLSLLALDGAALFGQSVSRRLVNQRNAGAQNAQAGDGAYNVAMLGRHDGLAVAAMPNAAPDGNWGAWFRGYGAAGNLSGDSNAPGANYFVGGAAMGIDKTFMPGFTAGLSVGYANTRADFQGSNSSGRIDAYDIGLYGSYQTAGFHLDAIASFALLDNKVDRQIVVGDLSRNANASYHGQRYGLALEAGYDLALGSFTIQPTVGMNYVHLRQNAFHEDGAGGLDLDGKRSGADSLRGTAGLTLGTRFGLAGIMMAPELRGRFEHEFLDNRVSTDMNFAGQAPAGQFTVVGVKVPRDSVIVGGGLAALLTPSTTAFVDYDYKFNKEQKIHNMTAGLRFTF